MTWMDPETNKRPLNRSPVWSPMSICQGRAPRDKVSLFTGPDKSGQVETFPCLCPPPRPDTVLKPDRGRRLMHHHSSLLPLLEAQLPGNQMFCHCALIFSFRCLPCTPTLRTHSFIHTQVSQELHHWKAFKISGWIIIRPIIPPILSLFASLPLQRRLSWTSSSLTPPISLSLGLHLKLMITRRARAATLVDRQVWELRLTNWSDGSDPPGNKSEATAIKEQCLNLPLSESGTSWEQTWCDELAEKASQPINSLRLPLRERFKHSRPVLMIKTDIWARPRHYWFYPSCLGEKLRREGVMIARFAFCDEIKRAGRSWNSIPKSKPQAVFHSWQQLLFTHRWRALKKNTAPFSSEAFSFTFYRSGHQINATHWCSLTHTHNQKL